MTLSNPKTPRIASIDLLRGLVMVIMALDHVRDYFHYDAFFFNPTDLSETNPLLFFTRFITHFCAPVFVFLAGTSAFFVGQRKTQKQLSIWLLKRGLWLIIVELTIIKFGWLFHLDMSSHLLQVIWALGASMIVLAGFIHLPKKVTIVLCLLGILGHNAFDGFSPESWNLLWIILHVQAPFTISNMTFFNGYPLIPWIFLMPLGYYFGRLYTADFSQLQRIRILQVLGFSLVTLFLILRLINVYGDPNFWSIQDRPVFTLMSFLNLTKYPPSALYLLITIGPSILFLAFIENWKGRLQGALVVIGRVPMFYYIIHIYIIHMLAMLAAVLTGFSAGDMVADVWINFSPELRGYGFNLGMVYLIWVALVAGLYPVCKWYDHYKRTHRHQWWLSYL